MEENGRPSKVVSKGQDPPFVNLALDKGSRSSRRQRRLSRRQRSHVTEFLTVEVCVIHSASRLSVSASLHVGEMSKIASLHNRTVTLTRYRKECTHVRRFELNSISYR